MISNAQSASALQTFSGKMAAYNKKRGKAK
jgi:hypothetical protein